MPDIPGDAHLFLPTPFFHLLRLHIEFSKRKVLDYDAIAFAVAKHQHLTKSESAASSLLPEQFWIVCLPDSSGLISCLDSTPVILSSVCIVHEQWSVHVWQKAIVDELLDLVIQCGV